MAKWKPQDGEAYFTIDTIYGETIRIINHNGYNNVYSQMRHDMGNMFQTKEQAEQALKKVKETLLNFHEENEKMRRWKPEVGERYFAIDTIYGETIDIINFNGYNKGPDKVRYDMGNCFKTEEQAEQALEKVKETLLGFQEEINHGEM